jgi:hypothetical protein
MPIVARIAAAAAAVVVIAFAGYQFLPRNGGIGGPGPTTSPSPTPSLLAKGTFVVAGHNVTLDAAGSGSDVSGTMAVASADDGSFTVAQECSRTIEGVLWIGGDVTESTSVRNAPKGTRVAIVLKPGSPAEGIFVFQMSDPRSASCLAFFDDMRRLGPILTQPIAGTVQLAP